jgi:hypothetical protein
MNPSLQLIYAKIAFPTHKRHSENDLLKAYINAVLPVARPMKLEAKTGHLGVGALNPEKHD